MNIKSKLSSLIETTFGNTNINSNCSLNSPQKSIKNLNKISPDTKPVTYALPPNDFNKINLNFINSSRSKPNIEYINKEEEKFNTNKQFQSPPQITAANTKTELFRTFSTLCTSPNKLNDCLKLTFNRKSINSPSKNINEVERKSFKGILYNIKDEETLENMIDKLKKRKNMDNNSKYNNNVEIKYLKKELISSPIKYSINKPQAILSSNRFNYNFTINDYISIKRET